MRNIVGQTPRGDDFFPRPTVVNRIYRAFANDAHLYLAAPRRVGKTAIMRHLEENPQPQYAFKYVITESVDNATAYFTVLVEAVHTLKKLPRQTLEALGAFLQRLRGIDVAGVGIQWEAGESTGPFAEFKKLVQTLDTNGLKVVIMIDEFPQTVKNILQRHGPDAAEHFLQLNREIRHEVHANIRFLLTGSIGLQTVAE